MTPQEASATLKQIAPAPTAAQCEADKSFERSYECRRQLARWRQFEDDPDLPGPRRTMETLLFGEPARCYLSFAVRDRLSRFACQISPPEHQIAAVWERVRTQMVEAWGAPSDDTNERCTWKNEEASLEAVSSGNPLIVVFAHPHISVVNTWRQHDVALATARDRKEAEARLRRKAAEQEAELKRRQQIERIRRLESHGAENPD